MESLGEREVVIVHQGMNMKVGREEASINVQK